MTKKIILTSNQYETRVALLENGRPTEYFCEKKSERSILTNVYKGVVSRVLPGMNSSFIDIGHEKAGFLFGGDVIDPNIPPPTREEILENPEASKNTTPIEKILKQGQEIICQVVKEPLGSKGPRISMGPKIPGRFLVLMPEHLHIGISRRIEDEAERQRLSGLVEGFIKDNGHGVIVRTAAIEASDDEIKTDLDYLLSTWKSIHSKISQVPAPGLLYEDVPIDLKIVRDLFNKDIEEIICDTKDDFERLSEFFSNSIPGAKEKLRLYEEKTSLFDVFDVEKCLSSALTKRAPLSSGGFLIIEQTEALTTIDINTGSYTGNQNQRDTILKTNLEAIPTIVEQLRFRNIGGIIIIDFIDMEEGEDREIVYNKITEEFKKDRARTNIMRMSDLGLIEMTRKRTDDSLQRKLLHTCPTCSGVGRIRKPETEALAIIRDVTKRFYQTSKTEYDLVVRDDIRSLIEGELSNTFKELITDLGINVNIYATEITKEDLKSSSWEVQPKV
jgi:ribonuclease G